MNLFSNTIHAAMAIDDPVCVTGDIPANQGPIAVYFTISYNHINPLSSAHPPTRSTHTSTIYSIHLVNPDSLSILDSSLPRQNLLNHLLNALLPAPHLHEVLDNRLP